MRTLYIEQTSLETKITRVIRDIDKHPIYLLIGNWGRCQNTFSVCEIIGNVLAEIRQTTFGVRPKFNIYKQNKKVGTLSQYFDFFNEVIFITSLHWIIIGNLNSGYYRIYHGTLLIMEYHQTSYQCILSITNKKYEPICICIAAVLDYWAHAHHRNIVQTTTYKSLTNVLKRGVIVGMISSLNKH